MDENLPVIRISVRNLVEFILREGDIDNRTGGGQDPENMQMGSRIHRKIQRQMGSDYQAEVPLKTEIVCDGFTLKIEGRADGLIHTKEQVMVDEIKGVLRELELFDSIKNGQSSRLNGERQEMHLLKGLNFRFHIVKGRESLRYLFTGRFFGRKSCSSRHQPEWGRRFQRYFRQ